VASIHLWRSKHQWLGGELLKVKNGNPRYFFWSGTTTPEDAPSYFQKLYRRVFKAAGIEGRSHDFRHSFAIGLLKAGVDIRSVSKALAHSSVTITEKFYGRWCKGQQAMPGYKIPMRKSNDLARLGFAPF
jgi:integrase